MVFLRFCEKKKWLSFESLIYWTSSTGGDHTRKKVVVTSKIGPMAAFVKIKATCIGCKAMLKRENEAVCDHCRSIEPIVYMNEIQKLASLEEKFSRLWVECQRCQDSLHKDVLCTKYVWRLLFILMHIEIISWRYS